MADISSRKTVHGLVIAGIAGLSALVYAPSLTGRYGRSDDYSVLTSHKTYRAGENTEFFLNQGRVVTAFVATWLFSLIDSVDEFSRLRWVSWAWLAAGGIVI